MKLPDTSINALALLFLAGLATGLAGMGLEAVLGEPASNIGQAAVTTLAFFVGFDVMYGGYALQAYRRNSSGSPSRSSQSGR